MISTKATFMLLFIHIIFLLITSNGEKCLGNNFVIYFGIYFVVEIIVVLCLVMNYLNKIVCCQLR